MPDSPAQNIDLLRKTSLDPGTERMATKEELISLLQSQAETELSVSEKSASQRIDAAEKDEAAKTQTIASTEKLENKSSEPDQKGAALRATPIPEIQIEEPA